MEFMRASVIRTDFNGGCSIDRADDVFSETKEMLQSAILGFNVGNPFSCDTCI